MNRGDFSSAHVECLLFVGVEVFCAETVMNPMQLYPQDNVNVLPPADEIKFLLTLRLVLCAASDDVHRPIDAIA